MSRKNDVFYSYLDIRRRVNCVGGTRKRRSDKPSRCVGVGRVFQLVLSVMGNDRVFQLVLTVMWNDSRFQSVLSAIGSNRKNFGSMNFCP